jgi:outer membrane murein-binding lipoprotein Lpp
MKTPRPSHRTLFLTALASLLMAGCSGGATPNAGAPADPVALIRSVSEQVQDIGSFRMTFDMRFEGQGQAIAATGDGEFFQDPPAMHATYRFDELPGLPSGAEMEMILEGSTFYMRMPELAGSQGLPTEWISMDIDEVAPGFDNLVELSRGQNDPTSSLAYLEGITEAEVIGTETVAGVQTTHYAGTVDLNEAVDQLSGDADASAREALAQAEKVLGKAPMPVDVWIDDEGLLRRMSFSMATKAGAAMAFSMEMTMEISEYGIDVELPIPPAEDVTDLTEMIPGGGY